LRRLEESDNWGRDAARVSGPWHLPQQRLPLGRSANAEIKKPNSGKKFRQLRALLLIL
jgi:hypothetical protein